MMTYMLVLIEPFLGDAVVGAAVAGAVVGAVVGTDAILSYFNLCIFTVVFVFRRFAHSINIVYKLI
jgi:hypothetical protein